MRNVCRRNESKKSVTKTSEVDAVGIDKGINQLNLQLAGMKVQKCIELYQFLCFESTEAILFFNPKPDETVEECMERRIALFTEASGSQAEGYKLIVPDGDPNNWYTSSHKAFIHRRAVFMKMAYILALEKMTTIDAKHASGDKDGGSFSFLMCCSQTVEDVYRHLGIPKMAATTLMDWNRIFRVGEAFPHVNQFCALTLI